MIQVKVADVLVAIKKNERPHQNFICIILQNILEQNNHRLIGRYRIGGNGYSQLSTIVARQMRQMIPDHIRSRVPSASFLDDWILDSSRFRRAFYGKMLRVKVLEEILNRNPEARFSLDEKMFKKVKE